MDFNGVVSRLACCILFYLRTPFCPIIIIRLIIIHYSLFDDRLHQISKVIYRFKNMTFRCVHLLYTCVYRHFRYRNSWNDIESRISIYPTSTSKRSVVLPRAPPCNISRICSSDLHHWASPIT